VAATKPREEITRKEAQTILGVSQSTVSRLVSGGKLTPSRVLNVGRRGTFMFWRADVERLAAERQVA
jgi:helix-turn-helix protein